MFFDDESPTHDAFGVESLAYQVLVVRLTYIKGKNNIVADALSRMRLSEKDFSEEAFAGDITGEGELPHFPLSYKQMASEQAMDAKLQERLRNPKEKHLYSTKSYKFSDMSYDLITRDDKIVIPKSMEKEVTEWYHEHLLHPGEKRLELTLRQHYTFIGLGPMTQKVCKACMTCRSLKANHK